MNKRGTRGLAALVCAAGMLPALAVGGAAQAAPVTCWGERATIVSHAEQVRGTPGDDVIVTTGRHAAVTGRGGDDTICVRGSWGFALIEPGAGDDRVRVEGRKVTLADLRKGSDTYLGGAGTDQVISGAPREQRNDDRIRLGAGDDQLLLGGAGDSRRATLSAGPGDDELMVGANSGTVRVDAAAEEATYAGRVTATWDGFESYTVVGARASFRGTDGADAATLVGNALTADTLGGDDTVTVLVGASGALRARVAVAPAARVGAIGAGSRIPSGLLPVQPRLQPSYDLDPGDGHDELHVLTDAVRVDGNLTTDLVVVTDESGATARVPATGFEGLVAQTILGGPEATIELVGDESDNTLLASSCRVVLRGGAGNDRLRVGADAGTGSLLALVDPLAPDCTHTSEMHGEAGDDTLVSRLVVPTFRGLLRDDRPRVREVRVRDVIDGGDGTDSADAGRGTDTCVAEVTVGCET